MAYLITLFVLASSLSIVVADECDNLLKKFRQPCDCVKLEDGQLSLDCDRVIFPNDLPSLPDTNYSLISYTQKYAGYQSLPLQLFTAPGLSLKKVDFSNNLLRRLTEKIFSGLKNSLQELRLADNLFGDALNPVFSSIEFHGLNQLRVLDLSNNQIRALEEGIFKGCDNLQELKLDGNRLSSVPSSSLNGPIAMKILSINFNRITTIEKDAFTAQPNLEQIDLMGNYISTVAGNAFHNLLKLKHVNLAFNKLDHLNSDVFEGTEKVHSLDLAGNFLNEFPATALKIFKELKYLNLSSNLIQKLEPSHMQSIPYLEILDLSRNNIATIADKTFQHAQYLRYLDISVNMLRAIDDNTLQGLNNLETLFLEDNNILLIPAITLNQLTKLKVLKLGYNRITAVSAEILAILSNRLTDLGLSYNVIRELPSYAFQNFKKLKTLDLSGNLLVNIEPHTFAGLEKSLISLNLRGNRISSLMLEEPVVLQSLNFLDVSNSHLKEISPTSFVMMPSLLHLNLSHNFQLNTIPIRIFQPLVSLNVLDLSYNSLKALSPELFIKCTSLEWLSLANNMIGEIPENVFDVLNNLLYLNLAGNNISNLKSGIFVGLRSLKELNLKKNHLTTFKGEFFITWKSNGTSIEKMDLSDNQISYLFPTSFKVHPNLRVINLARNKFNFFPGELIIGLEYLQEIDLSGNVLKTLDEFDFGRLPRLKILKLNDNDIEIVSETAFHNSTQLQVIDLSNNNVEKIGERTFQGLNRIERLNLKNNSLSELPDNIFDRAKVRMLENINLSNNKFVTPPLRSLQKQYFFLMSIDLSYNNIRDIPADDTVVVNIKELDLSYNPLTEESINNVLSEPKTARKLNLAGTGITRIGRMETPFIQYLNLSRNSISEMPEKVFERITLLEGMDVSNNNIADISNLSKIWSKLKNLQSLDISSNPIANIVQKDFEGLDSLRKLKMSNLESCIKIEKSAFKNFVNLMELDLYGYDKLGYLDVPGILHHLSSLETLNIEVKDPSVGSEQLSPAMNSRLHYIGIWGQRVSTLSSGALAGLKMPNVVIKISNTSLTSIPAGLLIPLPRSSSISLDLSNNQLTTLIPQFLTSLDDRRGHLTIRGLETNPIQCDCNVRALRRSGLAFGIRCSSPAYLSGKFLIEIADDNLTCDIHKQTSTASPTTPTPTTSSVTIIKMSKQTQRMTTEPDIIWSLPPMTTAKAQMTIKPPQAGMTIVNNDDTLIIGIVGGVVAFIALLIIIICIIRLRMSNRFDPYGGAMSTMPSMLQIHCNNPACPCIKVSPSMYAYNPNYTSTLPSKMASSPSVSPPLRPSYATIGRPYNQNPYCVPYSSDEKDYTMR